MDFHLEYRLRIQADPEHENLYKWVINEVDEDGDIVCRDQIPWGWSLSFIATEIVLSDELSIGESVEERLSSLSLNTETLQRRTIQARLSPSAFWQTTYRMFGTDRIIKDIRLDINPLESEDDAETCNAWGCVSNKYESDYGDDTSDDCIIFYLMVKPSTFDHYAARIAEGTADELFLSVGQVSGFYSECSSWVRTLDVKVLTDREEHSLQIPAGFEFDPPRLGSVGKATLIIRAKRARNGKQPSAADDGDFDNEDHHTPLVRPDAPIAPDRNDHQTIEIMLSLKRAARWSVGLLAVLVIATLLRL